MAHFVAPAAWGARNGPGIVRRALDAGRTWRAVLLMLGTTLFSSLFTVVWAVTVAMGRPLLSLVFGLACWSGWVVAVDVVGRWVRAPHADDGPVLATAPSGRPATAWLRPGWALARPWAVVAAFSIVVVGEGVAWVLGDSSAWTLLGAGFVVLLLVPNLWMARRGVQAGGLYLTAEGVEHVWGPASTRVSWESLEIVGPLGLERTPGLERVRRGEWWCVDTTDRSGRAIPIPSAYLGDRTDVLRRLLIDHATRPAQRHALGTSRSLEWAAAVAGLPGRTAPG
ncbi:hypothetical protein ASF37_04485 [Aeromicrobium sp. Leaf289]|uniref:hypothetical protein n=1 Tax=Aeromicrobium sp. Leaf289 TaxID=1736324 RepID=UPI0007016BF8|nr:hypothetical protein [Aeromicrobium sp. Leaf289]KQP77895.1 hypothetical protein ASF37_04485 [Aeromicrobium sp. Leaf289]